jgi:small-conductance mechanosensitive channel
VCLESCRHFRVVRFQYASMPARDVFTGCISLATGILFCSMLLTGMASLQTNSVSMIIVSRNVANHLLMFGDYVAFGNRPDAFVLATCSVLLAGALVAAWRHSNLHTTYLGFLWMVANCFSTSGYILRMKQLSTASTTNESSPPTVKLSMFCMIFVNNALCIALLLPAAYAMGEISLFLETTAIHTTEYATKNVLAGFVCFFFNFALLNCVWQSTEHEASRRQAKSLERRGKRLVE